MIEMEENDPNFSQQKPRLLSDPHLLGQVYSRRSKQNKTSPHLSLVD